MTSAAVVLRGFFATAAASAAPSVLWPGLRGGAGAAVGQHPQSEVDW
jgi:hypothetical protein